MTTACAHRDWAPVSRGGNATVATVFGLDVRCDTRLALLEGSRARPCGRSLTVREVQGRSRVRWPAGARTICLRSDARGDYFRIEAHPHAGYLIWARGRGAHVLSRDGRRLLAARGACSTWTWQRFLLGQVLPFAALVAGREILHASAVVIDGRAVALAGVSGAGKSTVALELCRRGATFLADDVLALRVQDETLLAQPGTAIAAVPERDLERVAPVRSATGLRVDGGDRGEQLVRTAGAREEARLAAIVFLDRGDRRCPGTNRGPRFEAAADARALLSSTFNVVLEEPARMRRLLEVCALAARLRVERAYVPNGAGAGELAAALVSRLRSGA